MIYTNISFLVQRQLSAAVGVAIKFYYEEVLDDKLKSPSRLQAPTDKVMDHVRKDHTFAFTKHLLIRDPTFSLEFLKHI